MIINLSTDKVDRLLISSLELDILKEARILTELGIMQQWPVWWLFVDLLS